MAPRGAATRCRPGWRARHSGLPRSAKPKPHSKPRRGPPQNDKPGGRGKGPPGTPADKAQRNFTDPQSRIMKTTDGFIQGFNAQVAVDATAQVIVAQTLSNQASDGPHLVGLVEQITTNLQTRPEEVSADAGYCSEDNLAALETRGIDAHVATGRHRHGAAAPEARPAKPQSRVAAMVEKLRGAGHEGPYRLRKQVVEPVFGQIKQARGFRQFLRRGLTQVQGEWSLICTVHNLLAGQGAFGAATGDGGAGIA